MLLGDWFWYAFGEGIVEDYDSENVNPGSYDLTMDDTIMLQVFRGVEYPNTKAKLDEDGYLRFTDPWDGGRKTMFAQFLPGDSFLASTVEYLYLPRWIAMQYLDKSSTGREGISHRHAGWIDPGFKGNLTLEFDVHRSGTLRPFLKVGQIVAHLTFAWRPYDKRKSSKYVHQEGVTKSLNKKLAFRSLIDEQLEEHMSARLGQTRK